MKNLQQKRFTTYEEQIQHLKSKKLSIPNEQTAIDYLKQFSYYSLVSGYKDIFKVEKNGDYKEDATFLNLVNLYLFDDYLRQLFLHEIIRIETHVKSLYSYHFCELYGDKQSDYLDCNNYNYSKYQDDINDYISIVRKTLSTPQKYKYVQYNLTEYGSVPLWIIIHTLTFGNLSKLYSFSKDTLQSAIAKEFNNVYGRQLSSMLNVLSKFRNVCAHGERLYNYKTQKSILDMPIHKNCSGYKFKSKNDLFNVLICFKYLSEPKNFDTFVETLEDLIHSNLEYLGENYMMQVLQEMGFPKDWQEMIKR